MYTINFNNGNIFTALRLVQQYTSNGYQLSIVTEETDFDIVKSVFDGVEEITSVIVTNDETEVVLSTSETLKVNSITQYFNDTSSNSIIEVVLTPNESSKS